MLYAVETCHVPPPAVRTPRALLTLETQPPPLPTDCKPRQSERPPPGLSTDPEAGVMAREHRANERFRPIPRFAPTRPSGYNADGGCDFARGHESPSRPILRRRVAAGFAGIAYRERNVQVSGLLRRRRTALSLARSPVESRIAGLIGRNIAPFGQGFDRSVVLAVQQILLNVIRKSIHAAAYGSI
jgi:hypothetical protein